MDLPRLPGVYPVSPPTGKPEETPSTIMLWRRTDSNSETSRLAGPWGQKCNGVCLILNSAFLPPVSLTLAPAPTQCKFVSL